MQYTYRHSALEKTKTIALTDDAIEITTEDKEKEIIPYQDIIEVNPKFVGSKNYPNMYQTVIKMNNGNDLTIRNHDYKGILSMDDISDLYSPFIAQLHLMVSKNNASVTFIKGYQPGWYWFFMMIFWGTLIFLTLVTIAMAFAAMYLYVLGILFGVWVIYKQMKKFKEGNKPTVYTVDNIPPHLFPQA